MSLFPFEVMILDGLSTMRKRPLSLRILRPLRWKIFTDTPR